MRSIAWLYDTEFEYVFKNIGKDLWEDLRQEVAYIVLQYDSKKIGELEDKGKQVFKFWIVRICCNQTNSKYGKFGRMYASLLPVEDIMKFVKEEEPIDNSQAVADGITKIVEGLYWYDQEILKMYVELGSVRKVSKQTGIPHTSIFITIKKIRSCIKSQLVY
jgi:transposase-like protein